MFMRASGASEVENFGIFYITKSAISFNSLSVLQIFCRYKMICFWHFFLAFLHTKSAIFFNILSVQNDMLMVWRYI